MPLTQPVNPGRIVWTGENHGILLKHNDDGPWTALVLFFRLYHSPHGAGTALLLYEKPDEAAGYPQANNFMLTDNRAMAQYLLDDFVSKLGNSPFAASAASQHVTLLDMQDCVSNGDAISEFSETATAADLTVELVWGGLGTPTALELPRELTGGKENDMYSLLIESREPAVIINGRTLPGRPVARTQASIDTTTAFLYFSETWIAPASTA